MNSNLGFETACNFPARYTYLKTNNFDVPNFNLEKCNELSLYLNSFSQEQLNLVFSSEYTNNPSSAFGHIMLLFTNKNEAKETGDVIHFAAKTPRDDGFFKYSYNGLTGKYNGYFIREPFFKKLFEYNTLEQRYIYVYELDFSKEQIKFLLYHLYELRKATFKYYFFDENCASQISELIDIINDKENKSNSLYYLPVYSLSDFKEHIINKYSYIPTINKIDFLVKNMSAEDKDIFYKTIKNSDNSSDDNSNIVKQALMLNTVLNFRKFNKVDKNYNNIMNQTFEAIEIKDNNLDPLSKTMPSSLEIGLRKVKDDYLTIKYRPLFIELEDFQINSLQKSEITTLDFEIFAQNEDIKLNYFNLINIKSLPKQLNFYNPLSWSIYLGFNKENYENELNPNFESGFGRTINLIKDIDISILFNAGIDNLDFYFKPTIYSDINLSKNFKLGINSYYKSYVNSEYYYNHKLYLSHKIDQNYINAEVSSSSNFNDLIYGISYKYNF